MGVLPLCHLVGMQINMHEVGMAGALVKYLLQQGYTAGQLVLLTPYLGQLMELSKELKSTTQVCKPPPVSNPAPSTPFSRVRNASERGGEGREGEGLWRMVMPGRC